MNSAAASPPESRVALLGSLPLFAGLDADALATVAGELVWFALPGGGTLFDLGEPSDALYVLISGSMGAFRRNRLGDWALAGLVSAGETVGEVGLITDQPRSATVRALRDSELLRLSRPAYETLIRRHPHAMTVMARIALKRYSTRPTGSEPRTFAILPQQPGSAANEFAEQLAAALSEFGECALIGAAAGAQQDSSWFSALESRVRYVLYLAGSGDRPWRDLCVRQADCLLFVADTALPPANWPETETATLHDMPRPRHLILLRRAAPRPGLASAWLKLLPGARHHHVGGPGDVSRLARLLTGRCLGLVLSGGGARGFAHIGVVKALREAGMRLDAVGGTSIGAVIAAGVAADWSIEEMLETYRRAFVTSNPLSDYTIPLVSVFAGRKVSRLLREAFGEREIEDLALPFFCVSANLTEGQAEVHDSGLLWRWLRASIAIPGVLPPVFLGGSVFVDGGVINNLPVDVMRDFQTCEVVAVDIGGDHAVRAEIEESEMPPLWRVAAELFGKRRRPGLMSILLRAGMVNSGAATAQRRAQTSLLLTPPLADIDLLEWRAFDRAVEAGYQYALRVIGGQKDALSGETPWLG